MTHVNMPEEDRSTHGTVVEYAVREMMKRKGPRRAAEITAQKLSGTFNMMLGPVIPLIDPKKLEVALWDRLVDQVLENIKRFKPGAEEMALGATINHFRQGKSVEKKVRALTIKRLGRDPFTKKATMNDQERKGLIRLAYENPELRDEILPMVTAAGKVRITAANFPTAAQQLLESWGVKAVEFSGARKLSLKLVKERLSSGKGKSGRAKIQAVDLPTGAEEIMKKNNAKELTFKADKNGLTISATVGQGHSWRQVELVVKTASTERVAGRSFQVHALEMRSGLSKAHDAIRLSEGLIYYVTQGDGSRKGLLRDEGPTLDDRQRQVTKKAAVALVAMRKALDDMTRHIRDYEKLASTMDSWDIYR